MTFRIFKCAFPEGKFLEFHYIDLLESLGPGEIHLTVP